MRKKIAEIKIDLQDLCKYGSFKRVTIVITETACEAGAIWKRSFLDNKAAQYI